MPCCWLLEIDARFHCQAGESLTTTGTFPVPSSPRFGGGYLHLEHPLRISLESPPLFPDAAGLALSARVANLALSLVYT